MSTKYGVTTFQKGEHYLSGSMESAQTLRITGAYGEDTPPPDVSDRIGASFPNYLTKLLHQRQAPRIAEMDK